MSSDEQFFNEIAKLAADTARNRMLARLELLRRRCESPVEERFLAALFYTLKFDCDGHEDAEAGYAVEFLLSEMTWPDPIHPFDGIYVYQQATVGRYRVDFLIGLLDQRTLRSRRKAQWIVVECDGHEFHERTKEQARRDKARDRWMTSQDIVVHRFTGSEIWRDAIGCAVEIEGEICRLAYDNRLEV